MVATFTWRKSLALYASHLMGSRMSGVVRNSIYSRFGDNISGFVGHWLGISLRGFYHAAIESAWRPVEVMGGTLPGWRSVRYADSKLWQLANRETN